MFSFIDRKISGIQNITNFQRVPMRFNVASTNDDVIHQRRGYVRKRVLPTINGESPNGKLHKNRMSFTNAMGLSNSAGSASTGKSSSSSGEQNGYVTTDARYTAARARDVWRRRNAMPFL